MSQAPLKLFDNTRINAFKTCPRYFLFAHVYHWQPAEKSAALIFGSSWHAALDVVWHPDNVTVVARGTKAERRKLVSEAATAFEAEWVKGGLPPADELSPDDLEFYAPRTPQIATEMLHGYIEQREHIFSDSSFKVLAVEQPFAVPLSPEDPTLFYVGRLDKVFEYRKEVLCAEHKTTTAYKKGGPFRADWCDSFNVSAQIDGYIFALRVEYGKRAGGVWIDGALVHKVEHSGFRFLPESRSDGHLDSWLWETHGWIDQIEGNKAAYVERAGDDTNYLAAFPRNTNSCVQYGRCPMLDVCRVVSNPAKLEGPPLGYVVRPWSPFSVVKLEELGFSVEGSGEPVKT